MEVKKNYLWASFIVLFILLSVFIFFNSSPGQDNPGEITGEAQEITLGMKNFNYYPQTITVESGKPVSITLDNSVKGCYRAFTIRDLGVQKYSASPSDKIVFTPQKKGTFKFACSMGMGYGTIIVK